MMYCAAFNVADTNLSLGTLTVATSGGPVAADVTLASTTAAKLDGSGDGSIFFPVADSSFTITSEDIRASSRLGHINSVGWVKGLQAAVRARMTAVGGGWSTSNFTISLSETTGVVTFAYTSNISLTWSTAAGRAICGFSANASGASSHAGTVVPTYCIVPTQSAVSDPTPNYEPQNIGNSQITDNGQHYGVDRYATPLCRDWLQQFETKAKTIRSAAASTHPFTLQQLFEHCRGKFPFAVVSGGFDNNNTFKEAFAFRTEGIPWNPQPASPNNFVHFHVAFRTWVQGAFPS